MEQRDPGRLAVDEGEDRLELRLLAEAVAAQIGLGGDHRVGRPLEYRQLADQPQQQPAILRGREADRDRAVIARAIRAPCRRRAGRNRAAPARHETR